MATVSFDKNVVINEPQAINRLVNSLKNEPARKVNRQLASDEEMKRSEQLLSQCLHSRKS